MDDCAIRYIAARSKTIAVTWGALWAEPFAILITVVALVCAIDSVSGARGIFRLLMGMAALLSAFSAWVIAGRVHW